MRIHIYGTILMAQLCVLLTPFRSSAKDHPHLFFDRSGMEALRDRALNNPRLNKIWLQFKTDQVDNALQ